MIVDTYDDYDHRLLGPREDTDWFAGPHGGVPVEMVWYMFNDDEYVDSHDLLDGRVFYPWDERFKRPTIRSSGRNELTTTGDIMEKPLNPFYRRTT